MSFGLIAYLDSVKARDPAARSRWDVLFYPGTLALGLHRVAHWLWEGRLFFVARLVNHFARFLTGDRHPSRREDRQALLPRPRLQRDRRDRRDRRRRHHLSMRHPGRDQPDHRRRRQAPPDASQRRGDRLGRAGARARSRSARAPRSAPMRWSPRTSRPARRWSASRPSRCRSTRSDYSPASCPTARRAARLPIRCWRRLCELEREIAALRAERKTPMSGPATAAAEGEERVSVVAPFPHARDRRRSPLSTAREWTRMLDLYGRMVAAGHWRDYAHPLRARPGGVRRLPPPRRAARSPDRETPLAAAEARGVRAGRRTWRGAQAGPRARTESWPRSSGGCCAWSARPAAASAPAGRSIGSLSRKRFGQRHDHRARAPGARRPTAAAAPSRSPTRSARH